MFFGKKFTFFAPFLKKVKFAFFEDTMRVFRKSMRLCVFLWNYHRERDILKLKPIGTCEKMTIIFSVPKKILRIFLQEGWIFFYWGTGKSQRLPACSPILRINNRKREHFQVRNCKCAWNPFSSCGSTTHHVKCA